MKTMDLIRAAISNTFRSKTRTVLTVLAIMIGAFTLTITNALGAGVSDYVSKQVASLGASDVLILTKADASSGQEGPIEYNPDNSTSTQGGSPLGGSVAALSEQNLDEAARVAGVEKVVAIHSVSVNYVQHGSSTKYAVSLNSTGSVSKSDLAAGDQLSPSRGAFEILLPLDYVEPLGFASPEQALGETVEVGYANLQGDQKVISLTVAGIANTSLFSSGASISEAAIEEINTNQREGIAGNETFRIGIAYIDPASSEDEIAQIKSDLLDLDINAQTTEDQLGILQTVINGIVGVLNAFAFIALLAAAFGIVNTLLMSVQERTREIGLMKAMGMSRGKIFGLFSLEAAFIGLLGSAIGSGLAIAIGAFLSDILSKTVLVDLPGLNILLFSGQSVLGVVVLIMGIAFLSGTLPARKAARLNPIDALRYE